MSSTTTAPSTPMAYDPKTGKKKQWTRIQMEEAIAQGRAMVLFHGDVYDLTKFLPYHPGGRRVVEYVLGMDATEAITVFHPESVLKTRVPRFCVGTLVEDVPASLSLEAEEVDSASSFSRGILADSVAASDCIPRASLKMPDPHSAIGLVETQSVASESVLRGSCGSQLPSEDGDSLVDVPSAAVSSIDDEDSQSNGGKVAAAIMTADKLPRNMDLPSNQPRPPPMDANARDALVADYLQLNAKLRELGFYKANRMFYIRRMALFLSVWIAAITLLWNRADHPGYVILSALMLGFTWHGVSFSVHDAGHHSASGSSKVDDLFSITFASIVGGLSVGWWRTNHNVHHVVTNHPRFFFNLYSTFHRRILKFDGLARLLVPLQHYLYFPVLTFGRFNLHALSWMHQLNLKEKDGTEYRLYELSCMTLFWVWYGALIYHIPGLWMKLVFFYLSNASTMLLHLQITLSHFGMSTEDVGPDELFVSKAVRTTMNVDCPPWFDWFHGGLNFQIEHHLFPRLPRCNFRKVQPYVMEFCKRNNMKYYTYTFLRGNGVVLGVLKEVAQQIQFLIKSADPSVRFQHEDHDSVKVLKSE